MVKMVIVGGVRNSSDAMRKEEIRKFVAEKGLDALVDLPDDVSYSQKVHLLKKAAIGIHTMRNEHFGISVVEFMAAGAVPIAHRSAGPLEDIVVPAYPLSDLKAIPTQPSDDRFACGLLAETADEYADSIYALITRLLFALKHYINSILSLFLLSINIHLLIFPPILLLL